MNYKSVNHFIVDIETLGTRVDSPILQIAAVTVNDGKIWQKFNAHVDIRCQATGANAHGYNGAVSVDVDTLKWWLERPEQLAKLVNHPMTTTLPQAIDDFRRFIDKHGTKKSLFWAKSPSFDYGILTRANNCCRFYGGAPWDDFRRVRDIRTLDDECLIGDWKENPTHDALEDCIIEANILIKAVWGDVAGN